MSSCVVIPDIKNIQWTERIVYALQEVSEAAQAMLLASPWPRVGDWTLAFQLAGLFSLNK